MKNILSTFTSKKGTATISREGETGPRTITVTHKGKDPVETPASNIDLRSMGLENLEDALKVMVNSPAKVHTFQVTTLRGKKAMVEIHLNEANGNGYAVLVRKGAKNFRVALNRIDLAAMKSETVAEACQKATWTGSLAPVKDAPAPEAAPAQA